MADISTSARLRGPDRAADHDGRSLHRHTRSRLDENGIAARSAARSTADRNQALPALSASNSLFPQQSGASQGLSPRKLQPGSGRCRCFSFRQDKQVPAGCNAVQAQSGKLPKAPFASIALRGAPEFFPHHRAHARAVRCGASVEKRKERAGCPSTFLEDQPDIGVVAKKVLCAGGTVCPHRSDQTVSLCRPLARRRARIRRPPFELIRARNPWVRLRALFEGCRIVEDISRPPFSKPCAFQTGHYKVRVPQCQTSEVIPVSRPQRPRYAQGLRP